jgi:predicted Zn-dependent protease
LRETSRNRVKGEQFVLGGLMRIHKKVSLLLIFILSVFLFQSVSFANSVVESWALRLERDIGRSNYQSVTSEKTVVRLQKTKEQDLQRVFRRLANNCKRNKELDFTLTVVRDDTPNAFALPAGYVCINTGLLSMVKNDGELAGILGHEMAHIECNHAMKAIYRAIGFSVAFSLVLNHQRDKWNTREVAGLAGISLRLSQLGYSRQAELEADRQGVEIMEKAGYNKQDILNFWQRFQSQNGDASKFLPFLSTHPTIDNRIEQIKKLP